MRKGRTWSQSLSRDSLHHSEDHGGVPSPCMEVHGEAELYRQPMESHNWGRWMCPEGSSDLMDSLHWNRLLAGPQGKPKLEQVFWQNLGPPGESMLEQIEELQPVRSPHIGEIHGRLFPWKRPHVGEGAECE